MDLQEATPPRRPSPPVSNYIPPQTWGCPWKALGSFNLCRMPGASSVQRAPFSSYIDTYDDFTMNNGVKQGCILAFLLFNIYLSDLEMRLIQAEGHCPTLSKRNVCALSYADDAVLSFIRLGLKYLLEALAKYCWENQLSRVPSCVPNSLRNWAIPLITNVWLSIIKFWLQMFFKTSKEIPNESFIDIWFKQVTQKINQICIDQDYLFSRNMTLTIHCIKDKSVQELIAKVKV